MKPAIIGAGSWGTALAITVAQACGEAILFARDDAKAAAMMRARENPRLPGIDIPSQVLITAEPAALRTADCIIIATPAQAMRAMVQAVAPNLAKGIPALIAAKGIERGSNLFMSDVLREVAPELEPFALTGPSFAADVANGLPTAVTLAGFSLSQSIALAARLSTRSFRIYAGDDLRGAEFGGAVKNVLAVACGMAHGLSLGDSARAALTTRGFAELMRAGAMLGARRETLLGLSGLGDLLLTASSAQSRNFALGVRLARGQAAADPSGSVTEGAWTAPVIVAMARERNIEMPVAEAVSRIIAGESTPAAEVERLLSRPLTTEF